MEALAVLSVEGKAKEGLRVLVFGVSVKFLCESLFLGDVFEESFKGGSSLFGCGFSVGVG